VTRKAIIHSLVAALFAGAGLWLIFSALTMHRPGPDEVKEITGTLVSYVAYDGKNRHGPSRKVILTLAQEPYVRFWTDAISKKEAPGILMTGSRIRLFVQRVRTATPVEGNALKAYGLWVDGRELQSLKDGLEEERWFQWLGMPLLGLFLILLGAGIFKSRKKTGFAALP
jgi:hypothetical protein